MEYQTPKDHILKCKGDVKKIPPGWALCDGTDGTPNLPRNTDNTEFYIIKL